jgi:general secretion pathway protein D
MKKLILLILLFVFSFGFDIKKVDLHTFCSYISYFVNKNIIISDDVPLSISVFMPNDNLNKESAIKVLHEVVVSHNLHYSLIDSNTLLIYKKNYIPIKRNYFIKFDFIPPNKLSNILKSNFPQLIFSIFQNRVVFRTDYETYNNVKFFIKKLESSYQKANVKFYISVINNKKLKEKSFNFNIKNPFEKKILLNLVTNNLSVTTSLPSGVNFSSFINFLNQKNVAETISRPTLTLIDSSDYTLESVHNVPFITKTVTVDNDGNPVTTTDIKYKDIGLKIYIKNVSITKNNIDFDMDIFIENIISIVDNLPITDTKHFNTHVQLTKNNSKYIISGIRSVTKINENSSVPGLSSIHFLGFLFSSKKSSVEDLSFLFLIETDYFSKTADR